MPLHPSQVYHTADTLIDRAFAIGETYQTIAKKTGVKDSTVRNWHRRKRAKLSAIQPLIDHVDKVEKDMANDASAAKERSLNHHNLNDLIESLKHNLVVKIKDYLSGKTDNTPVDDAQLLKLLLDIQHCTN